MYQQQLRRLGADLVQSVVIEDALHLECRAIHLRAPTGWVFPDLTTNRNRDAWVFLSTLNRFVALYCGLDQLHRGRNLRGRSIKEREFVSPIRRKFTWVKGGELESNSHGSLFRMSSSLGVCHQSIVA